MKLALKLVIPGFLSFALIGSTQGACREREDSDTEKHVVLADIPEAVSSHFRFDASVGGASLQIEVSEDGELTSRRAS